MDVRAAVQELPQTIRSSGYKVQVLNYPRAIAPGAGQSSGQMTLAQVFLRGSNFQQFPPLPSTFSG